MVPVTPEQSKSLRTVPGLHGREPEGTDTRTVLGVQIVGVGARSANKKCAAHRNTDFRYRKLQKVRG